MESTGSLTLDFEDWQLESQLTGHSLLITSPSGKISRRPISWIRMFIGGESMGVGDVALPDESFEPREISLVLRGGGIFATQLGRHKLEVNGQPQSFAELKSGDCMRLGGWTFHLLTNCEDPIAFLEGLSDPHRGFMWPLGKQPVHIGRGSSRENTVELRDRSVSRAHATVAWNQGQFLLEPETQSSICRLNSERVESSTPLQNGDLLMLGGQLLRFQTVKSSLEPCRGTALFLRPRCDDFWSRPVEAALQQMIELLRASTRVVESHGGIVTRYVGDAALAVFTGARHAHRALTAGLAAIRAAGQLGSGSPSSSQVSIGCGVASGEMAVGVLGANGKADFGAVGSPILAAARLEMLGKEVGETLLVARDTADQAPEFSFQKVSQGSRAGEDILRLRIDSSSEQQSELGTLLFGTEVEHDLEDWLKEKSFQEGDMLFEQGSPADALYLLESGAVALTAFSTNGREYTLAIRRGGELVGESALLDGDSHEAGARVLSSGRCRVLSASDWKRFVDAHPEQGRRVIQTLCSSLRDSHTRIEDLGVRTVRQRLAAVLVRLAEQDSARSPGGLVLPESVSYSLLVGLLCTNRETISRAGKELTRLGLLRRENGRFLIPDLELLREAEDQ